jgi:hypothetical protein
MTNAEYREENEMLKEQINNLIERIRLLEKKLIMPDGSIGYDVVDLP